MTPRRWNARAETGFGQRPGGLRRRRYKATGDEQGPRSIEASPSAAVMNTAQRSRPAVSGYFSVRNRRIA